LYLQKNGLGYILGDFFYTTHLVTLLQTIYGSSLSKWAAWQVFIQLIWHELHPNTWNCFAEQKIRHQIATVFV
jgi:hypothetical protein